MRERGRPRAFETKEQMVELYREFCNEIRKSFDEDVPHILPSKTNFSEWVDIDRKTFYNYCNEYFPTVKKDICAMMSDTLTEGAARGIWQQTIIIFALKNWCGWTDKVETKSEITGTLDARFERMRRLMDE